MPTLSREGLGPKGAAVHGSRQASAPAVRRIDSGEGGKYAAGPLCSDESDFVDLVGSTGI